MNKNAIDARKGHDAHDHSERVIRMTATTLTTAQLADEIGTTPKTLRKFLRADARSHDAGDTLPGKGSRYAIDRKAVKGLKTRYAKWDAAEKAARAARAQLAADAAQVEADDAPDA